MKKLYALLLSMILFVIPAMINATDLVGSTPDPPPSPSAPNMPAPGQGLDIVTQGSSSKSITINPDSIILSGWPRNFTWGREKHALCGLWPLREDNFLTSFVKFKGSITVSGFTECLEDQIILLKGTVLYTMGEVKLSELEGSTTLRMLEKAYDVFHTQYAETKSFSVENIPNKTSNTLRAFNILGEKFPKSIEGNYDVPVSKYLPYDISRKKSYMIMGLYKAAGVKYPTKPLVISSPLISKTQDASEERSSLAVLDTPYYKDLTHGIPSSWFVMSQDGKVEIVDGDPKAEGHQSASSRVFWTYFNNGMGRTIIFSDSNNIEAYIKRALNDTIIIPGDVDPSFLKRVESTNLDNIFDSFEFYDRNPAEYMLTQKHTSIKEDAITAFYQTGSELIQRNKALTAMVNENEGYTLLEYITLAYRIMHLSGEPILTEVQMQEILDNYGAVIPAELSNQEREAVVYLVSRGILDPRISYAEMRKRVNEDQAYEIILRIADKGSRLGFSMNNSEFDKKMASRNLYKSKIIEMTTEQTPTNMEMDINQDTFQYVYYLIPKMLLVNNKPEITQEEINDLHWRDYDTEEIVSTRLPDIKLGKKGTPYFYLKVPKKYTNRMFISSIKAGIGKAKKEGSNEIEMLEFSIDGNPGIVVNTVRYGDKVYAALSAEDYADVMRNLPKEFRTREMIEKIEDQTMKVKEIDKFALDKKSGHFVFRFQVRDLNGIRLYGELLQDIYTRYINEGMQGQPMKLVNSENVVTIEEGPAISGNKGYVFETYVQSKDIDNPQMCLSYSDPTLAKNVVYMSREGQVMIPISYLTDRFGISAISYNNKTLKLTGQNGREVLLYEDRNFAVKGSVIVKFEDDISLYTRDANKNIDFLDARVVTPFLRDVVTFTGDGQTFSVNGEPKQSKLGKVQLWTDSMTKHWVRVDDSYEKVDLTDFNALTARWLVMRDIKDKSTVKISRFDADVSGNVPQSANLLKYFSNLPTGAVKVTDVVVDGGEIEVTEDEVWYKPSEMKDYAQDKNMFPIFRHPKFKAGLKDDDENKGRFIIDNIPLLIDDEGKEQKNILAKPINISYDQYIKGDEDYAFNPFTGEKSEKEVVASTGKAKVSAQPYFLQSLADLNVSYTTKELTKGSLVLMGGVIYKVKQSDSTGNSSIILEKYYNHTKSDFVDGLPSPDEIDRSRFLNSIGYETSVPENTTGQLQLKHSTKYSFVPLMEYSKEGDRRATLYVGSLEVSNLSPKALEKKEEKSVFQKVLQGIDKLFGDAQFEKIKAISREFSVEAFLYLVMWFILNIFCLYLSLSLLAVTAISLMRNNKVVERLMAKFDIVKFITLGIASFKDLHPLTSFISGIFGTALLVMIQAGLVFRIVDYLFSLN